MQMVIILVQESKSTTGPLQHNDLQQAPMVHKAQVEESYPHRVASSLMTAFRLIVNAL